MRQGEFTNCNKDASEEALSFVAKINSSETRYSPERLKVCSAAFSSRFSTKGPKLSPCVRRIYLESSL